MFDTAAGVTALLANDDVAVEKEGTDVGLRVFVGDRLERGPLAWRGVLSVV